MPPNLDQATKSKKGLLRYLRWRDLIVIALGVALGFWINAQYFKFKEPTDYQKWQARPKLDSEASVLSKQNSSRGINPCLFIVPPGAVDQPVASGSIGECLLLVPDGRKLDVFEVSLWWGTFFAIKTDLYVPDTISLAFTRTSNSDYYSGQYHNYFRHVYEPFLIGDRNPYTYLRCFFPDGINLTYQRISPGTGFVDAVYEDASPFPLFQGSRFAWNGWGWDLALPDGMTYLFPEAYNAKRLQQGSLVGIFDGNGNEVRLTRKRNGDLAEITSPNGSRINFSYTKELMSRAADSFGNSVDYAYDERRCLRKVTDSHGETMEYQYNLFSHVVRIVGSNGSVILENSYDPHDRENKVVQLSLQDGRTYTIHYAFEKQGGRGHVDVADPSGEVTRVNLEPKPDKEKSYYSLERLSHF
jgi:YD repeat-containing protein